MGTLDRTSDGVGHGSENTQGRSPHIFSSPLILISSYSHILIFSYPHISNPHILISSRLVSSYLLFSSYSPILIFSYPHILISSYPHILISSRPVSLYLLFSSSHPPLSRSQTQDFPTASVTFRFTKPYLYILCIFISQMVEIL